MTKTASITRGDDRFTPGVVRDNAFPRHLVDSLAHHAGQGAASGRTGISNHVRNAFEGWTGSEWPESYFDEVAAVRSDVVEMWAARARDLVRQVFGMSASTHARSSSGRLFAPAVVRQTINGIDWHFDDARLEYPGTVLDLGRHSRQYSVITYLNTPEAGGDLEVAAWRPADAGAHPKESYPLDENRFSGAERFRVQPTKGRTAILSSEFAHRVHATEGPRKFVTMFVAVSGDGTAISFG